MLGTQIPILRDEMILKYNIGRIELKYRSPIRRRTVADVKIRINTSGDTLICSPRNASTGSRTLNVIAYNRIEDIKHPYIMAMKNMPTLV